jgi:hypothetical protein
LDDCRKIAAYRLAGVFPIVAAHMQSELAMGVERVPAADGGGPFRWML